MTGRALANSGTSYGVFGAFIGAVEPDRTDLWRHGDGDRIGTVHAVLLAVVYMSG